MTGDALVAVLTGLGAVCIAAAVWPSRERRALPQRRHSETVGEHEQRAAHVEAVRAQCTVSARYVAVLLAAHEPEVTGLLELALEVDEARPVAGIGALPYDD